MSARKNLQDRKRRRDNLELPDKLRAQQERIFVRLYPRKDSAVARKKVA